MKHQIAQKLLALLIAGLLIAGTLLTGCVDKQTPATEHVHETPATLNVSYAEETDGTLTCTVTDCEGAVLFTKKELTQQGLAQAVNDSVFSLSWVTNATAPDGFESVYFDRVHCRVSPMISGVQATDGVRVLYAQNEEGACSAVVQDLFDKTNYCETYPLTDAYTGGDYTFMGSKMTDDTHATLSYLVGEGGAHRIIEYDLYPDGKPTEQTEASAEPTETENTEKTQNSEE